MKIIILAAGKGERLLPLTRNTPKSLLEIGNGMTVLENQLAVIGSCGIKQVVIVTGYKTEQIEAKIKDFADFSFNIVFNPFFEVSNNLVSAWMARHEMTDNFIIVNGDVVFNNNVLEGLLNSQHHICIGIHRKPAYDQEDMKVVTVSDAVHKISKEIPVEEANGESIGMLKFTAKGRDKLLTTLDKMVRDREHLTAFLPKSLQRIAEEGFPINYCESSPEDSAEIDFHPDLEAVRTNLSQFSLKIAHWGIDKK